MQFFSTRDQNRKVTSSQAIAQGLSDEGGLFVPESFPQVDVKALCGLDYPALAAAVVREYLTDYDPAFLTEATRSQGMLQRPAAAVDPAKQHRLICAAQGYLQQTGQSEEPVRFDVAEVVPLDSGRWMVHIIKGAFLCET